MGIGFTKFINRAQLPALVEDTVKDDLAAQVMWPVTPGSAGVSIDDGDSFFLPVNGNQTRFSALFADLSYPVSVPIRILGIEVAWDFNDLAPGDDISFFMSDGTVDTLFGSIDDTDPASGTKFLFIASIDYAVTDSFALRAIGTGGGGQLINVINYSIKVQYLVVDKDP